VCDIVELPTGDTFPSDAHRFIFQGYSNCLNSTFLCEGLFVDVHVGLGLGGGGLLKISMGT
jgi:hypothetical protein